MANIMGGKCGCSYCKNGSTGPSTRAGWASMRNKKGASYVGKLSRKSKKS